MGSKEEVLTVNHTGNVSGSGKKNGKKGLEWASGSSSAALETRIFSSTKRRESRKADA